MSVSARRLEIDASEGRQARRSNGRREVNRETGRRAGLERASLRGKRRANLMKIRGIVHLKARFDRQDLRIVERSRIAVGQVRRDPQLGARIEHDAQLPARTNHVLAAERMVRVIQIADCTRADTPQDGAAAHEPSRNDGTADARVDTKGAVASAADTERGFLVARGCSADQIDGAAEAVPAIERPLRPAEDFDPVEIQKIREHHGRPGQVHAIEIQGRTRIGPGGHRIGPYPADGDLSAPGVLCEGDPGCATGDVLDRVILHPSQLDSGQDAHRHRDGLHISLAGPRRRDDGLLEDQDRERQ